MPDSLIKLFLTVIPRFPLGDLVATQGALENIVHDEMQSALNRHASGDWGDLDDEDKAANDRALQEGTRLFSAFKTKESVRFYIITEGNRRATTILLPEEY